MFLELTTSTALLLALCTLYEFNIRVWGERQQIARISSGLIFGTICIVGMMKPITIEPGVIFDARSVILSLAAVFGGAVTGGIAALIAAVYRLWLGGAGAPVGAAVIVSCTLLGLVFRRGLALGWAQPRLSHFLLLGLVVHLVSLLLFTRLPALHLDTIFNVLALPYVAVLTLGTALLGLLLDDLQAQRRAKLALVRSEALRDAITRASPDLLLVLGEDGRYLDVISPDARLLYAEPADIIGRHLSDALPPEQAARFQRFIHQTLQAGTPQVLEYTMDTRGGRLVFEGRAQPLSVRIDGQRAVIFVARDITDRLKAEEERRQLLERFGRLAAHLPGYLYQYRLRPDGTSHFPFATERIEFIYGCTVASVAEDATPVFKVLHPDDSAQVAASIALSARELTVWHDRYRVLHPTRGLIWIEGQATPEKLDDGSILWHGYLVDVTQAEAQRERLKLAEKVFSATQEGILVTDANSTIVEVNDAFVRITGYSRPEVIGRDPSMFSSGRQGEDFYRQMWEELRTHGRWQGEIWNRRKNGEVYAELLSIDAIRNEQGKLQNYVAVFTDINQLKKHEREIDRATYYDSLTGLPNRRSVDNRLQVQLEHAKRRHELVAVCIFDLDNFKQVNDAWGYEAGNELLVQLARKLQSGLPTGDTLARVGGDEFVLLLHELSAREDVLEQVDQVFDLLSQPLAANGQTMSVTASMGIAIYPELDLSADELLRYADQAMYRAKQKGRNRYEIFEAAEDSASRSRDQLLREAEDALRDGAFRLYFQPKLDLQSNRICSAEALIRWKLPDGRIRMPGEFIEILNGYEFEIELGNWIVDQAMAHHRQWAEQGFVLPVSINVSVDHLLDDSFVTHLRACLARHRIQHPEWITIEILETSRISDFQRVRGRLMECRQLGVKFSLDDFGTGYSSMTYMRQLPVDVLKIDRSFVSTMLTDAEDLNIVKGIIALGHAFGRTVVAEGVETEPHIRRLRELGCDMAQGYGVSRPMPAQDLPVWAQDWNRSHAPA
jgi:diguanylate cyclase (GGDEF)-like protein/PAS domain S-box-containing protein